MRVCAPIVFALALSAGAAARPPVLYTSTGGSVDLLASDPSGVAALLLTAPPGPTSFGIGGGISTPGVPGFGATGMAGDSTVSLGATSMFMVGAILGGTTVPGGAVSGFATADIEFTLSNTLYGTFAAGFTLFDPDVHLSGTIFMTGPDAASTAFGTHFFDPGDYHLHAEVSYIGALSPGDSGHLDFGARIDFLPMPTPGAMAGAGLLATFGVRRRR